MHHDWSRAAVEIEIDTKEWKLVHADVKPVEFPVNKYSPPTFSNHSASRTEQEDITTKHTQ